MTRQRLGILMEANGKGRSIMSKSKQSPYRHIRLPQAPPGKEIHPKHGKGAYQRKRFDWQEVPDETEKEPERDSPSSTTQESG
ncbi:MAG: hypothetical protein ABIH23_15865 [bacterium]